MGCGKSTAASATAPADSKEAAAAPVEGGTTPKLLGRAEVNKEDTVPEEAQWAQCEEPTEQAPQEEPPKDEPMDLEAIPEEPTKEAVASAEEERGLREFRIVLDKSTGMELGVDVDVRDGKTLVMENLQGGLLEKWNLGNRQNVVKHGDLVVEVNSIRDDADKLVAECKQDKILVMTIRRPPQTDAKASAAAKEAATTEEERLLPMNGEEEHRQLEALRNISVKPQEEKSRCDIWCC